MWKRIIIISGPSCAGKSTIANEIFQKVPSIVHVKTDTLKKFISHYDPVQHKKYLSYLTTAYCENVMQQWLSLIVEPHMNEGMEMQFRDMADKYWYSICIVSVNAPYEVILQRFQERVQSYITSWSQQYLNTDENRLKDMYQNNQFMKIWYDISIDTSIVNPDEACDMIIKKIN